MLGNCYTIFITPPKGGETRKFYFNKRTLYVLIFGLLIFITGDVVAIVKYRESVHLKNENTHLKTVKEELKKVAQIVNEVKKEESFVRNFLGLEKSGSGMGGLGMGGADPNFIANSYIISPETDIIVSYNDSKHSKQKVSLIEKAFLLKKDLQELKEELIDRKNEWDTRPTIMPVKTDDYWISSGFGWRKSPFTDLREFHSGLDIAAKRVTPIIAPANGKVISVGKDRYTGRFVKIKHNDKFTTIYGHLLQHKVEKGKTVKRGDLIGLMGSTGLSTGDHLHYEVRKDKESINPFNHILNLNTANAPLAMR